MKQKNFLKNKEIITIIIGIFATILVIFLTLFTIYKISTRNISNDKANQNNSDNTGLSSSVDIPTPDENNNEITPENKPNNDLSTGEGTTTPSKITAYIFKLSTCPHCRNAASFFESLLDDYSYLEVKTYEVSNKANSELMNKVTNVLNLGHITSVPLIIIGNYSLNGYTTSSNDELKEALLKASKNTKYEDVVANILNENPDLKAQSETLVKN